MLESSVFQTKNDWVADGIAIINLNGPFCMQCTFNYYKNFNLLRQSGDNDHLCIKQ